jgi:hypothetical protein
VKASCRQLSRTGSGPTPAPARWPAGPYTTIHVSVRAGPRAHGGQPLLLERGGGARAIGKDGPPSFVERLPRPGQDSEGLDSPRCRPKTMLQSPSVGLPWSPRRGLLYVGSEGARHEA